MANVLVKFKFPKKVLFRSGGKAANQVMARESIKGVTAAGLVVEQHGRREAPKSFNDLARSISSQVLLAPLMAIVSPNVLWAIPVHEGRKPGKQPPLEPLKLWVKRKLGVSEGESTSVAFLVARKIGRHGTQPNQYMTRALEASQAQMKDIWNATNTRIVKALN